MTTAQKAILQTVCDLGHPTADCVYVEVRKTIPNVALGTIYRNLSQFAERNVIRRVQRGDAPDYFDGNVKPHDHVVCQKCGMVSDVSVPGLLDFVNAHSPTEVLTVEISASHICNECAGN